MSPPLHVGASLSGKQLLLTGVTGFVGKTLLAWLICHHPDIARISCVIRRKGRNSPADRLATVLQSPPLEVARRSMGAALDGWVEAHLQAVHGDLARPGLGISEEDRRSIGPIDLLINVAASVDFTPPLDKALSTNAEGALHVLGLARELGARLLHVSTCYVAGYASGRVAEEIDPTTCPHPELRFDVDRELEIARRMVARIKEDRDDPLAGRPRRRLRAEGEERARALGWPNTYTYTKALAEKLISRRGEDVPHAVVRLAIVESAWRFPLPGWSEGGNGSAGCVLMASVGQRWNPGAPELVLDLVPVDLCARAIVLVSAALISNQHHEVYHVGTSDDNPLPMHRVDELVNVWRHRMADEEDRSAVQRAFLRHTDTVYNQRLYELSSAPALKRTASRVGGWLKRAPLPPRGRLRRLADRARALSEAVERTAVGVEGVYEVYGPFIRDVDVRFSTRNLNQLSARLAPEEAGRYRYDAVDIDWYSYFQEVHLPGLQDWIFPDMLRRLRLAITPDLPSPPPLYGDLIALLERAVADHARRPAVSAESDGQLSAWNYQELQRRAELTGRQLVARGIGEGDRVLLQLGRTPRWPLAYFAILYAGATVVPVDADAPPEVVARLAERAHAALWIVGESQRAALEAAGKLPADRLLLARDLGRHQPGLPELPEIDRDARRPASILFTSGTTGDPRGVVLSHRNFLSVVRGVQGVYALGRRDRFLSLLPLHHAFEFSAGLLYPVSVGAEVVYPEQVGAERLGELLGEVEPTAMVAVPALWTALQRRLDEGLDELPALLRHVVDALARHHGELRSRTGLNLGPWLFWPLHRSLGRLRHMVSGGAALPEAVLRDFYRWGFNLSSGYGLTEAAPVLTVAPPGTRRGDSVGPSLVGIDVRIHKPDEQGIGEVIARGPNIMQGYLDDPVGTQEAIRRGWLHTGDLGRMEDGHLVLVGRAKEVIVASSGENVYPDELEDRLSSGVDQPVDLAALGMPDGQGGERVTVVVVPEDPSVVGNREAEAAIRREIAAAGTELPASWRPAEIRFREEELPRTTTLKVQRARLRQQLIESDAHRPEPPASPGGFDEHSRWLVAALARAAGQPVDSLEPASRLGVDVPLDSLGWMDVVALIERRLGRAPPVEELTTLETVGDVVQAVLARRRSTVAAHVPLFYGADGQPIEDRPRRPSVRLTLPRGLRLPASQLARRAHGGLTDLLLDIEVRGSALVPEDRPVLVVCNHGSHLDSGVLRHALGRLGEDLPLLAAQDYFFGTPFKDLVFGELLDLVPTDRHRIGLSGVRSAVRILQDGRSLALFPEGTRSRDGQLAPFRAGAVLIALEAGVDILPVHIGGTHDILAPGELLPRGRRALVHIGRSIPHRVLLRARRAGMGHAEAAERLRASVQRISEGGDAREPWADHLDQAAG